MVFVRCTLTFSDGKKLTGSLNARFPGERPLVSYDGELAHTGVDSLLQHAAPSELELMFRVIADRENALLSVDKHGEYESRIDLAAREVVFRPRDQV